MMRNRIKLMALLMVLLLTLGLAGCDQEGPATGKPANPPSASADGSGGGSPRQGGKDGRETAVTVYYANQDATALLPVARQVAKGKDPMRAAIGYLIAGGGDQNLANVFPSGTKLRALTVKDGVAYADFNRSLIKNFQGGSANEVMLIGSIVNTLTEFPDVKKVQILVDGRVVENIGGNMDLTEPLGRWPDIIKK